MNRSTPLATYSDTWFSVFAESAAARHTELELGFLTRHLPLSGHPRILDLCCGSGRHAALLAAAGYTVTGVDNSAAALERARALAPDGVRLITLDMRSLSQLDDAFDGAINMWQSFGYYDDVENGRVLGLIADRLRPRGRCVVDLYNLQAARKLPEYEKSEREGTAISTRRSWHGERLRVHIDYDGGRAADTFEWRIYDPEQWEALARSAGFETLLRCAWFDESIPPSAEHLRMQFVMEKAP